MDSILGIDVGGTGIKAAPVDLELAKILEEPFKMETPDPSSPENIIYAIGNIIDHFNWKQKIGIGFPAVIKKGIVYSAANISDQWINYNLYNNLKKKFENEFSIINDADAAGLAEIKFGAGIEYSKHQSGVVIMITLGTGIGTAIFNYGHILPNTELGHIEIDSVDAEKRAATVVKEKEKLNWEEWGQRVNKYFQTMEMLFSPDIFIIGGGVSESHKKFFKYIDVKAEIVPAKMGNDAGIVGAALAFEI